MVIMFIAPGRSIHSNNWASSMCDRGHEVHFVTQDEFLKNMYSFVEKVDERFIIHELPYKGRTGFFLNKRAVKKLTKEINPDVIHVQQAAGYGLLGSYSDKSKAIVSVYGWEVYDLVNSFLWKTIVSHNLHWYNYIGSTSHCMKEQILKEFKDLRKEIYVTPFGIDMKKFKEEIVSLESKAKDEIIIGTVKKMDKKYGIEYLIRSFAITIKKLKIHHPEVAKSLFLELVGPGNQSAELKALAKELEVYDRVRFIGKIPHSDVPKWLNRFDVYVAPSILDSESFGVAVIEASACGKPVIVSDVGGLPEVVDHRISGFVIPSKDVSALSNSMTKLILDKPLRQAMGKAGVALVKERYDWEYCVDLMEDIYTSIVGNRGVEYGNT